MSVTGPDFISLQVRDLERAAQFYEGHLGLQRAPQSPPNAVVFSTTPIPFAVREPLPGTDLDSVAHPGVGVGLWLQCDGVEELHAALVAAGTQILAPPTSGPFGTTFVLADPDGYAITVHGRP